jgi:hypothetical protein
MAGARRDARIMRHCGRSSCRTVPALQQQTSRCGLEASSVRHSPRYGTGTFVRKPILRTAPPLQSVNTSYDESNSANVETLLVIQSAQQLTSSVSFRIRGTTGGCYFCVTIYTRVTGRLPAEQAKNNVTSNYQILSIPIM